MDPIFDAIQQNLNSALSIPFVSSAVTLGLAFYAYKAAPELPSFVEELFLNVFFQVFVGFMVLYMTTGNVMLSLVVSAVFIYGMKMLSNLKEGMFGGGDITIFINNKFENALIDKLINSDLTDIISQMKVEKLILEILNEKGYTREDMGKYLYGKNADKHDINKYIDNALSKVQLKLIKK